MNTKFKKILICCDNQNISKWNLETIKKTVDDFTYLYVNEKFSIPLETFQKFILELNSRRESEIIYEIAEKYFNNYIDEIHDLTMEGFQTVDNMELHKPKENIIISDSWESRIVYPTILVRDHKQDNRLRNKCSSFSPRILQFIVNEKNTENPGKERIDNIFNLGVDKVICFTSENENNQYGIEYVRYVANKKEIPINVFMNKKEIISKVEIEPIEKEKLDVFERIEMNSAAYQEKYRNSVKMIKQIYYNGITSKSKTKVLSNEEIENMENNKKIKNKKEKITNKTIRKRMKTDKIKSDDIKQETKSEILEKQKLCISEEFDDNYD